MKKLMSRCLALFALIACLSLVSAIDFRTNAFDPPCPLGCHNNCRAALAECEYDCGYDEECIHKKCKVPFENCIAYCDWVCGPE